MKEEQVNVEGEQVSFSFHEDESIKQTQTSVDDKTQAFASLGMLSGGIAHDFNNLLSVILGNVSLANRHISSPEQMKIYLSRIEQASTNAANLCQQMLAYTGRENASCTKLHLPTLVENMARLMEVALHKHVRIIYEFADDLPLVCADESQLQQVVMNLITNANEALFGFEEGEIKLRIQPMLIDEEIQSLSGDWVGSGAYICIEVIDNGCGMSEETQVKIFEPTFTTKSLGHGMGLSAMLGIVRRHLGLIQLKSKLGVGSVFSVALPALDKLVNQDDDMKQEYDALEKFQPSGKILLVDDEEVVLEIMQVMLEDLGYTCILAQDGAQALEQYQQHHNDIEIVIMDMTMPCMGGKVCVAELQKVNPDIKIILSSGYEEEDVYTQLKGLRVAGFLHKPCNLEKLHAAIKHVR